METGFARCSPPEDWEIEGHATYILQMTFQDGAEQPDVEEAIRTLGFLIVRVRVEGKRGWTDWVQLLVYCRPEEDFREEIWTLAHELAHIAQELWGRPSDLHDEDTTDQIARAILMPEKHYRKLLRVYGAYHPKIGQEYPHVPRMQRLQRAVELGFLLGQLQRLRRVRLELGREGFPLFLGHIDNKHGDDALSDRRSFHGGRSRSLLLPLFTCNGLAHPLERLGDDKPV